MDELYQSRANRDKKYRELKAAGLDVSRRTVHNQQLHPMYVEDVDSSNMGKGLGNTHYRTFFATLYTITYWDTSL